MTNKEVRAVILICLVGVVMLALAGRVRKHRDAGPAAQASSPDPSAPTAHTPTAPAVSPQDPTMPPANSTASTAGDPDATSPQPVATPRGLGQLTKPSILIEKSAGRLTVFDGGRAVKVYTCITGRGRVDKTREGDECTPEGEFYVCVKNPQSSYHLSLGLSYPNIEDARRGLVAGQISRTEHNTIVEQIQARRQPLWSTAIGGEIMIHGEKNGRDGTAGCIALDNSEVEELFAAIPLGTPVTIRP